MIGLFIAAVTAGAAAASPLEADTPEHAIRNFYGALQRDDDRAYARLTSAHFYAFDAGKRFSGPALLEMVEGVHASGTILQWNLSHIDVHIRGASGWASWENHGAVGKAGALKPISWQESATLHRSGHRWMIDFLHSNRSEPAPHAIQRSVGYNLQQKRGTSHSVCRRASY